MGQGISKKFSCYVRSERLVYNQQADFLGRDFYRDLFYLVGSPQSVVRRGRQKSGARSLQKENFNSLADYSFTELAFT